MSIQININGKRTIWYWLLIAGVPRTWLKGKTACNIYIDGVLVERVVI